MPINDGKPHPLTPNKISRPAPKETEEKRQKQNKQNYFDGKNDRDR